MTRLRELEFADLGDDGKQLWERIVGARSKALTSGGTLAGPFNAFVHAPSSSASLLELGEALRNGSSLDPRAQELVTLVVASRWKARFTWMTHVEMARLLGIDDQIIDAIEEGAVPPATTRSEAALCEGTRQLVTGGSIDDDTYHQMQLEFDTTTIVDLVLLCGYYTSVAFIVNAFAVEYQESAS